MPVQDRLKISAACPLILLTTLDQAREARRGENKIGTTGRGIGLASSSARGVAVGTCDLLGCCVARRSARLSQSCSAALFTGSQLSAVLDEALAHGERLMPMGGRHLTASRIPQDAGASLFQGAQGSCSISTTVYLSRAPPQQPVHRDRVGFGPLFLDYVLGIPSPHHAGTRAFPTELFDGPAQAGRAGTRVWGYDGATSTLRLV